MARIRKLSGLEIDEVSLVDRPANQHGLVAIAKRAPEDSMGIFDAEGFEVDESDLEHGDTVYDESGQEFVYVEDGAGLAEGDEGASFDDTEEGVYYGDEYTNASDEDLVGVGKAFLPARLRAGGRLARSRTRDAARGTRALGAGAASAAGDSARGAFRSASSNARGGFQGVTRGLQGQGVGSLRGPGGAFRSATGFETGANTAGRHVRSNRVAYGVGAGGAGVAGGGAAYGNSRRKVNKSLGEQVLVELSKAMNDGEREEIIAKALDLVDDQQGQIDQLHSVVSKLVDARESEDYTTIAQQYELPVDPGELGGVLKRASRHLSDRDLAVLDRILSVSGEAVAKSYDEVGFGGLGGPSEIMDQVAAIAGEAVSKTEAGALTPEQAVVAVFDANPQAYDEYLQERY